MGADPSNINKQHEPLTPETNIFIDLIQPHSPIQTLKVQRTITDPFCNPGVGPAVMDDIASILRDKEIVTQGWNGGVGK